MVQSVEQDGMRIDWDVEIAMDDGPTLRADVFQPRRRLVVCHGPFSRKRRPGCFAQLL